MIKRIELVNFLSHEHSVIDLTEGLNVLVGPNNCGKSSIVTALQVLCYNDDSKFVLRHGAKECSVQIETDEGHVVRWTRKKSGSPKYEINGETFDRLGRNGVPEKLHEVLRLPRVESEKDVFDVHFGEQRSPVFLLNDKPRAAAEFFASSSDASRLVEMQQLHKQRVRDSNSSLRKLNEEACELELALDRLAPTDALLKKLETTEQRWESIQQAEEDVEHLRILVAGMHKADSDVHYVTEQSAAIADIASPPKLADTDQLEEIIARLRELANTCHLTGKQLESLESLRAAPTINETTQLAASIAAIEKTSGSLTNISNAALAFQNFETPPDFVDSDPLTKLIEQQSSASSMLEEIMRQSELLGSLPPCPAPIDAGPIAELAKALQEQTAQMKEMETQNEQLNSEVEVVASEIADWANENPECPTCGGAVTAEQLTSRGGHNHDS